MKILLYIGMAHSLVLIIRYNTYILLYLNIIFGIGRWLKKLSLSSTYSCINNQKVFRLKILSLFCLIHFLVKHLRQ